MICNAFVSSEDGELTIHEPDLSEYSEETVMFLHKANRTCLRHGAFLCLSQTVSLDSLLTIQQIVHSELAIRAEIEMNPELHTI